MDYAEIALEYFNVSSKGFLPEEGAKAAAGAGAVVLPAACAAPRYRQGSHPQSRLCPEERRSLKELVMRNKIALSPLVSKTLTQEVGRRVTGYF